VANRTQILVSARDQASAVFGRVAKNSTRAQKNIFGVNNALRATDKSIGSLSSSVKGLVGGVGAGLGISAIFGSVKDAIAIKVEYDKINNVLKAVTGSASNAATEFKFLTDESERLGIQLRPLAQSYTRLAAAGNLLGLTTDNTREIFTSFSEALTGFGATREQSIRVFTAIEQILSKGKVSAEELRQQLGEALPGSFQLAAKAAGVTVQELDGMLKRGELLSSEFILPFARAVRSEFGGAAVEGAKLLNAEFSRTINILDQVKLAFVEGGDAGSSLSDSLARVLKSFREFLSDEDRLKRIAEAGVLFGTAMEAAAQALQKIASIGSSIPTELLILAGGTLLGRRRGRGGSSPIAGSRPLTNFSGGSNTLGRGALSESKNAFSLFGNTASLGALALQEQILKQGRPSRETFSFDRFGNQTSVSETLYNSNIKETQSVFKRLTKTVTAVTVGLVRFIGPLGLAATGIAIVGERLLEFKRDLDTINRLNQQGERSTFLIRAFNEIGRRRRAGEDVTAEDAEDILNTVNSKFSEYALITDDVVNAVERQINATKKVPEVARTVVDPVLAVIRKFSEGTAEIARQSGDIARLGLEEADRQQRIREHVALLGKENVTRKKAIELAKKRVAEEDKLNKQKSASTAIGSAKDTIRSLQDEVDVRKKFKGQSKQFIDDQVRLVGIIRGLLAKEVSLPRAKELAREQLALEQSLRENTAQKILPEQQGLASGFNTIGVAQRIQARVQQSDGKSARRKAEREKKEQQKQQKEQTEATKNTDKTITELYNEIKMIRNKLRLV
jgi:tape measure domain-containing protein